MQTLAVTFYNVVVWLHISSVVLAFGPTFAFGIYVALAQRKYPRAMPAVLESQITISRSMVTIGGVLILITGLYLAGKSWEFERLLRGLGPARDHRPARSCARLLHPQRLARPTGRKARYRRRRGRPARSSSAASSTRTPGVARGWGPVAGLIVILTIYVMAAKPFL